MKILIDLTSLADNFSGIERYAASLTFEMIKQKENQYILIFKESIHPMFLKAKEDRNVEMVVLPRCQKLIFNQVRLPLEIYKHKADAYLFLAFPVPVLLFKRNMISTIHDICCWDCPETMNGMSKWYFRLSHRIAMLKCWRIVTISKFSEDRIATRLKYPREKIWLVYCGVEKKFLQYKPNQEKDKAIKDKYHLPQEYILSLSTLEPRKNLRLLVEAYRERVLKGNEEVPLVLAGRKGWKMDELLAEIEPQVKKKIIFTGFIDDEDLPSIYGNAKVFVFPSRYEGFGIPPLEAMACGTPVISSNAASMPEVLGDSALFFENNQVVSLEQAMKMIFSMSDSDRNELCYCGMMQTKKFSWNTEAAKMLSFLKKG
jgi:glycosyltransferase involved in cell wall biosynthesis